MRPTHSYMRNDVLCGSFELWSGCQIVAKVHRFCIITLLLLLLFWECVWYAWFPFGLTSIYVILRSFQVAFDKIDNIDDQIIGRSQKMLCSLVFFCLVTLRVKHSSKVKLVGSVSSHCVLLHALLLPYIFTFLMSSCKILESHIC